MFKLWGIKKISTQKKTLEKLSYLNQGNLKDSDEEGGLPDSE